jgi:hypothetical protein
VAAGKGIAVGADIFNGPADAPFGSGAEPASAKAGAFDRYDRMILVYCHVPLPALTVGTVLYLMIPGHRGHVTDEEMFVAVDGRLQVKADQVVGAGVGLFCRGNLDPDSAGIIEPAAA